MNPDKGYVITIENQYISKLHPFVLFRPKNISALFSLIFRNDILTTFDAKYIKVYTDYNKAVNRLNKVNKRIQKAKSKAYTSIVPVKLYANKKLYED